MDIRTNNLTKKLIFILILIIFILSFLVLKNYSTLNNILNKLEINIPINDDYELIDNKIMKLDVGIIRDISIVSNLDILKIKELKEINILEYIDNKRKLIDSSFSEYNSPYPGALSNKIICSEKYIPKIKEKNLTNSLRIFYYLYANDRFAFGGCVDDVLDYLAVLAFIYCKEKNILYEIKYFTPKNNATENYKKIVESFTCKI